jgi:hypothetical protein
VTSSVLTDVIVGIGVGEFEADLEEQPAKRTVSPASQQIIETTLRIFEGSLWLESGGDN